MARIVNSADPDNAQLYPSENEAKSALLAMLEGFRERGFQIDLNDHEDHRFTVTDASGSFVGDFYVED